MLIGIISLLVINILMQAYIIYKLHHPRYSNLRTKILTDHSDDAFYGQKSVSDDSRQYDALDVEFTNIETIPSSAIEEIKNDTTTLIVGTHKHENL